MGLSNDRISCIINPNVEEIRKLRSDGIKRKDIASKFNITPEHVYGITSKKSWSHI